MPSDTKTDPMFQQLIGPSILVFRPDRDKDGGDDYTKVFKPESQRFAALYGVPPANIIEVDVSLAHPDRKGKVLETICARDGIRAVVFFCHGWTEGVQLGFRLQTVKVLAAALKAHAAPNLVVMFYACSAGDGIDDAHMPGGEGGFCDVFRDALVSVGLTGASVGGHSCVGNATKNPFVRRFLCTTVLGGEWIVEPDAPAERAWATLRHKLGDSDKITPDLLLAQLGGDYGDGSMWARWRFALRDTDLRFRFPFLSIDQIRAELAGA